MSRTIACPEESALLAVAAGAVAATQVRSHVDSCPACRKTVRRLEAEIVHLRAACADQPWSPPPALAWRGAVQDN